MTNAEARRILVDEMDAKVSCHGASGAGWMVVDGELRVHEDRFFRRSELLAIATYLDDPEGVTNGTDE